eukprot:Em0017g283a
MNYSLTCVLSNLQSYAGLHVLFRLEIRGPHSTLRASQSTTSPNISCYFSPLVVSDGGNYTCNGTVFVMEDNSTHPINSAMTTITVEIPFAPVPEIYPVAELTYAGSRLLLNCTCTVVDALPNQTMVDMLWYKDNNLLLNNTYLLVGPTTPVSPTSYVKRLWFTPAMEQDSGVYLCNVTIRPMVPSMYVHSQVQSTSYRLSVTVPMVGVSLESPSLRALTMHPYNVLHLMCSATVVGVVVYPFIFSWNLVVNKSAPVAVADGINTTDSIPPVGLSSVQVTVTSPGVYVYNCSVTISEASASGSSQTTITVSGPSLPLSPTNLQALEVNTSSVSVTWTVTKVAFTPEVYSIRFWSPPSTGYTTSDKVNGTSDIVAEDMQYTILLTGLTANLHYVFQVEAKNTVGSTLSATIMSSRQCTFACMQAIIFSPILSQAFAKSGGPESTSIAVVIISTISPSLILAIIILIIVIAIVRYRCAITQVTVSLREDVDMKDSELDMGQKFKMTENESYEDIILKRNIVYQ